MDVLNRRANFLFGAPACLLKFTFNAKTRSSLGVLHHDIDLPLRAPYASSHSNLDRDNQAEILPDLRHAVTKLVSRFYGLRLPRHASSPKRKVEGAPQFKYAGGYRADATRFHCGIAERVLPWAAVSDEKIDTRPSGDRAWALALLLPTLLLLPFIAKPFHIDDTVYVWVGQQIQSHPLDFFGFRKNWHGGEEWVYEFNKNPPGISYYLALAAFVTGWNEIGLHLAFLIPPALASLGIYFLAVRLSAPPLLAMAVSVTSPAFVVSSTNVMCESGMLACYIWAVYFWERGLGARNARWFILSASTIAAGALIKYVVITAVPLLFAYTFVRERRFTAKMLYLIIPLAVLVAYDLTMWLRYDTSLIASAVGFSVERGTLETQQTVGNKAVTNLSFLGGCYIIAIFLSPFVWGWRGVLASVAVFFGVLATLILRGGLDASYSMYNEGNIRWDYLLQLTLFLSAGTIFLAMVAHDIWRRRDASAGLLALWIFGIFAFGAFINWTINVRALLPMAPAVGILIARRLEDRRTENGYTWKLAFPFSAAVFVCLATAWGDYQIARASRDAADEANRTLGRPAQTVWFQGHWGFQYYMEGYGYVPSDNSVVEETIGSVLLFDDYDLDWLNFSEGEYVVLPQHELWYSMPREISDEIREYEVPASSWVTTMNRDVGAGFYSHSLGALPYFLGSIPAEKYTIYKISDKRKNQKTPESL